MKTLFIALLLGIGSSRAQRIFYTSQDMSKPYDGRSIKAIHPHWLAGYFGAHTVSIDYVDGKKQIIPRDSIWGFEDDRYRLYRCYNGGIYQLKSTDGLVRYIDSFSRYQSTYFSKTLDSPLRGTKREAEADSVATYQ